MGLPRNDAEPNKGPNSEPRHRERLLCEAIYPRRSLFVNEVASAAVIILLPRNDAEPNKGPNSEPRHRERLFCEAISKSVFRMLRIEKPPSFTAYKIINPKIYPFNYILISLNETGWRNIYHDQ